MKTSEIIKALRWEGGLTDCDTEVSAPITHWMPLPTGPEMERWNG